MHFFVKSSKCKQIYLGFVMTSLFKGQTDRIGSSTGGGGGKRAGAVAARNLADRRAANHPDGGENVALLCRKKGLSATRNRHFPTGSPGRYRKRHRPNNRRIYGRRTSHQNRSY